MCVCVCVCVCVCDYGPSRRVGRPCASAVRYVLWIAATRERQRLRAAAEIQEQRTRVEAVQVQYSGTTEAAAATISRLPTTYATI
eukprot:COSAG02_NODE_35792_length_463_cov_0.906593_1_plen_85_part_00